MLNVEEGIKYLQGSGAKITSQRIAIMKSLEGRDDHPSAERIFLELKPMHPTLSIATVYSTTQLLAQASMLRILSIDEKKVYFDPDTSPHAHFMCTQCKKIVDINVDFEMMTKIGSEYGIESIDNTEIFHYGVCSECAGDKKHRK
jgi:Fur family peroxide stress response transcriptional regulator